MFSTKDRDNDIWRNRSSAQRWKGAWWYKRGHYSNLNGLYLDGETTQAAVSVTWNTWKGSKYSLKKTEMKIRPYGVK